MNHEILQHIYYFTEQNLTSSTVLGITSLFLAQIDVTTPATNQSRTRVTHSIHMPHAKGDIVATTSPGASAKARLAITHHEFSFFFFDLPTKTTSGGNYS
ncbi:hypothetical protein EGR_09027 [Echinococcus granulosus]|uniref:Uncharacterized protein n=1 Tax=Echinococcus granulosus TaxID=6210 RepID=W6U4V5_ECHGR|nr:hypothetical protein EGR_09027 [Echinococcus granulosus]EUB56135.1 hypothetical protein EGR_09027 [Echinococcus granulosus]